MPCGITLCFLFQIPMERFRQVNASLIGKTNQNEQHVRKFILKVRLFVGFLEALFPVGPRNDAGNFSNLFNQLSKIRQLGKIPNANILDPLVDFVLSLS